MSDQRGGIDLEALQAAAVTAARQAGAAVLEVYESDFAVEHKDDKSPLTLADKRSHEVISRLLSAGFPEIPILSEEGKNIPYAVRRSWRHFWLVDPLDGTKEFIKRNGEFTVNIALIDRDRPILGVIFVPVTGTMYAAADGLGAWRERHGERLGLPLRVERRRFTIVGSRSHATPELERFVAEMRAKHGDVDFVSAGSSLKFCLVAEGNADIYPRFGPTMEWDVAAGQAIVEQSGGSVTQMEGCAPLAINKENLLNPWFVVTRGA